MPSLAIIAGSPLSALIDVNFLLINRIFVLTVTLLVFTAILFVLRRRKTAA